MTAKLYKIYPEFEGITGIKTGKSYILRVYQYTFRGKQFLSTSKQYKK